MNPGADVRAIAAHALAQIVIGQSRRIVFASASKKVADPRDRALLSALLNEGARWWLRFAPAIDALVTHPLRDADVQALAVLGLVQLEILQLPDYAAVAATVDATRAMGKPKFAALTNALLRRWLRERELHLARLDAEASTRTAHPPWLIKAIARDYPNDVEAIAAANNVEAPVWLRVNSRRATRSKLIETFAAADVSCYIVEDLPDALILREGRDITTLPGFADGLFSVQDGAAQYAAQLIDASDGMRILDACAAPGGKTAHLLERRDGHVVALDKDGKRLERVKENLDRLGLHCELRAGDAGDPHAWWDGVTFDRILLDAPCSATGIIRRQSDIKLHRRESDISPLVATQSRILDALWPLLKRGGRLVYATCSILAAENARQIDSFLTRHADAKPLPLDLGWRASGAGMQNLPGEAGMDGFFYAVVEKYN